MTTTTTPNKADQSTALRTAEGGESAASSTLRAALRESIRMDPPPTHAAPTYGEKLWNAGDRFPEASNDAHACAGTLSPACMSEGEFVAEMERLRAGWSAMIDAMLDATAPGWREERDRQAAAAAA